MRTSHRVASATLATTLLGAGLSVLALPATAAATTCQNRPVTITGTTGTEGDDVMVVEPGQYSTVNALGGADLICIAATPLADRRGLVLDAGPGDDTVVNDSTDVESVSYTIILGTGSDSYRGLAPAVASDVFEYVYGGVQDVGRYAASDTEVDVIETGGGNDTVHSGSTTTGAPNADTVRTGSGVDTVRWAGEQTGATLDLGTDANVLELYAGWQATSVVVDTGRHVATGDGRPLLRWTGDVNDITLDLDNRDVSFVGSDADETVMMDVPYGVAVPAGGIRTATMGRGDDVLRLMAPGSGDVDGGPGNDTFYVGCATARLRLGGTSTCVTTSEVSHTFDFARWEDLFVSGADVSVRGSDRAEKMKVVAARIRVQGRGGADRLNAQGDLRLGVQPVPARVSGGRGDDRILGTPTADYLRGGSGDDKLFGQRGDDTLRGGTGRDKAVGKDGRDSCSAEVRRTCESR